MGKNSDWEVAPEVTNIMSKMVDKFSELFSGFDVKKVGCVFTTGKKVRKRVPIDVRAVSYPNYVWLDLVYTFDINKNHWYELDDKRKNTSVFHAMLSIPESGFDEESKFYAKKRRPDFNIFIEEYHVTGGILDWMEDDESKDPMEIENSKDDGIERRPVTVDDIEQVG